MAQPIIRGIQAVGACTVLYRYNTADHVLPAAAGLTEDLDTSSGINLTGFRLDSEFLRANPQLASSVVIPILGGGGVALTNNNRTGTLTLSCARVSRPATGDESGVGTGVMPAGTDGIGLTGVAGTTYAEAVVIAQAQQAQKSGDSVGATLLIAFDFNGKSIQIQFEGCTVATVDPVGLSGNDAVQYSITWNYLNWGVKYGAEAGTATFGTVGPNGTLS